MKFLTQFFEGGGIFLLTLLSFLRILYKEYCFSVCKSVTIISKKFTRNITLGS